MDDGFAKMSGAPEAGGATTRASWFGGGGLEARLLRFVARWARAACAGAYRRLRDLDATAPEPVGWRGRPHRVHEARDRTMPH
jgi:hypothetical protein